jgi:hypothetical protein
MMLQSSGAPFQIAFEDQRTIDKFCEEVAPQVAQL